MAEVHEPAYLCVDTRAAKIVRRLSDEDRLAFFDAVLALYFKILAGEMDFDFPDSLLGDLLRQAGDTLVDGYRAYIQKITARRGKNQQNSGDPPPTDQRPIADYSPTDQRGTDARNQDQNNLYEVNDKTIKALRAEGFDDSEIDEAISRSRGRQLTDPVAYLRKAILNGREKMQKKLPAKDYPQRSYDAVQAHVEADMARRVAAHEARKAALTG